MLPINELEKLGEGDMYMKRLNCPPVKTHFERTYKCQEFDHKKISTKDLGIYAKQYNDPKFVYSYLENDYTMSDYHEKKNYTLKNSIFLSTD